MFDLCFFFLVGFVFCFFYLFFFSFSSLFFFVFYFVFCLSSFFQSLIHKKFQFFNPACATSHPGCKELSKTTFELETKGLLKNAKARCSSKRGGDACGLERATTHNFPTNIVFQRNEIENEVPFICICNVIFFGGVGYLASQN